MAWLVVQPPLWKIWTSIGMMTETQYSWENAKFMATKPPTFYGSPHGIFDGPRLHRSHGRHGLTQLSEAAGRGKRCGGDLGTLGQRSNWLMRWSINYQLTINYYHIYYHIYYHHYHHYHIYYHIIICTIMFTIIIIIIIIIIIKYLMNTKFQLMIVNTKYHQ